MVINYITDNRSSDQWWEAPPTPWLPQAYLQHHDRLLVRPSIKRSKRVIICRIEMMTSLRCYNTTKILVYIALLAAHENPREWLILASGHTDNRTEWLFKIIAREHFYWKAMMCSIYFYEVRISSPYNCRHPDPECRPVACDLVTKLLRPDQITATRLHLPKVAGQWD